MFLNCEITGTSFGASGDSPYLNLYNYFIIKALL